MGKGARESLWWRRVTDTARVCALWKNGGIPARIPASFWPPAGPRRRGAAGFWKKPLNSRPRASGSGRRSGASSPRRRISGHRGGISLWPGPSSAATPGFPNCAFFPAAWRNCLPALPLWKRSAGQSARLFCWRRGWARPCRSRRIVWPNPEPLFASWGRKAASPPVRRIAFRPGP